MEKNNKRVRRVERFIIFDLMARGTGTSIFMAEILSYLPLVEVSALMTEPSIRAYLDEHGEVFRIICQKRFGAHVTTDVFPGGGAGGAIDYYWLYLAKMLNAPVKFIVLSWGDGHRQVGTGTIYGSWWPRTRPEHRISIDMYWNRLTTDDEYPEEELFAGALKRISFEHFSKGYVSKEPESDNLRARLIYTILALGNTHFLINQEYVRFQLLN